MQYVHLSVLSMDECMAFLWLPWAGHCTLLASVTLSILCERFSKDSKMQQINYKFMRDKNLQINQSVIYVSREKVNSTRQAQHYLRFSSVRTKCLLQGLHVQKMISLHIYMYFKHCIFTCIFFLPCWSLTPFRKSSITFQNWYFSRFLIVTTQSVREQWIQQGHHKLKRNDSSLCCHLM